jgi:hypothetical protein
MVACQKFSRKIKGYGSSKIVLARIPNSIIKSLQSLHPHEHWSKRCPSSILHHLSCPQCFGFPSILSAMSQTESSALCRIIPSSSFLSSGIRKGLANSRKPQVPLYWYHIPEGPRYNRFGVSSFDRAKHGRQRQRQRFVLSLQLARQSELSQCGFSGSVIISSHSLSTAPKSFQF